MKDKVVEPKQATASLPLLRSIFLLTTHIYEEFLSIRVNNGKQGDFGVP